MLRFELSEGDDVRGIDAVMVEAEEDLKGPRLNVILGQFSRQVLGQEFVHVYIQA